MFGLVQSSFILEGTRKKHLRKYAKKYHTEIVEIKLNERKMLGLAWSKAKDTLVAEILSKVKNLAKLAILQKLVSIYDSLEIILSRTIIGKFIYRDICDCKLLSNNALPCWVV